MNIFVLDVNPIRAAEMHCDKHVVKMILETAQLLSTAHHVLDEEPIEGIYKKTHMNHPCAVWVRESIGNYTWAFLLGRALCKEYTRRYGKVHKTEAVLELLSKEPKNIPREGKTKFVQAMPDEYKSEDVVEAYQRYYIGEKLSMLTYKNSTIPNFLTDHLS